MVKYPSRSSDHELKLQNQGNTTHFPHPRSSSVSTVLPADGCYVLETTNTFEGNTTRSKKTHSGTSSDRSSGSQTTTIPSNDVAPCFSATSLSLMVLLWFASQKNGRMRCSSWFSYYAFVFPSKVLVGSST